MSLEGKRLTEDDMMTEAEIDPKGSSATKKPSKRKSTIPNASLGDKNLDELRIKNGHTLAKTALLGILGIYVVASIGLMISGDHEGMASFSLEIVRLLIPPLTFILGFLFGTKQ